MLNQYFQNGRHLYNLKIFTSKFQKMCETKKIRLDTFKCSKFFLFYKKINFRPKKMQITDNFDIILKHARLLQFFALFWV